MYELRHLVMGRQAPDIRNIERIARGTYSPGTVLLRNVEKIIPGPKAVFENGPLENGKHVPLWQALSGPIDEMWSVLAWFSPAFERSRLFGYTQTHRVDYLIQHLTNKQLTFDDLQHGIPLTGLHDLGMGVLELPEGDLPDLYVENREHVIDLFKPPVDHNMDDVHLAHPIAKLTAKNAIKPTLGGLAAAVALWRIAHFLGEGWREMDDLMRGLMLTPRLKIQFDLNGIEVGKIPTSRLKSYAGEVLRPLGIEGDFMDVIRTMWESSEKKYKAVVHTLSIPSK